MSAYFFTACDYGSTSGANGPRVVVYTINGTYVRTIGGPDVSGEGQLVGRSFPCMQYYEKKLYVLEQSSQKIKVYEPITGAYLSTISNNTRTSQASSFTIYNDNVYILDKKPTPKVVVLTIGGTYVTQWNVTGYSNVIGGYRKVLNPDYGTHWTEPQYNYTPIYYTPTPQLIGSAPTHSGLDRIYVFDTSLNQIKVYNLTGGLIITTGARPTGVEFETIFDTEHLSPGTVKGYPAISLSAGWAYDDGVEWLLESPYKFWAVSKSHNTHIRFQLKANAVTRWGTRNFRVIPFLSPAVYPVNSCCYNNEIYTISVSNKTKNVKVYSYGAFGGAVRSWADQGTTPPNLYISDSCVAGEVNQPPVAVPRGPAKVFLGSTINLNGERSYDPDGDSITYAWSVVEKPTGATTSFSSATTMNPTLSANRTGIYKVKLIVNDGYTDSAAAFVTVGVEAAELLNRKPVAVINGPISILLGSTINLDGTNSYDPDGDALTYAWNISAKPWGATATLSTVTGTNPTLAVDMVGDYDVRLVVNDGQEDSSPVTHRVNVFSEGNNRPVAIITGVLEAELDAVTIDVDLSGASSYDPDGDPITYSWELLNQPIDSTASFDSTTVVGPTLTLDSTGYYTVQLIVNDGEDDSYPATHQIFVEEPYTSPTVNHPPIAIVTAPSELLIDTAGTIDGLYSYDPDGDAITYAWEIDYFPTDATCSIDDSTSSVTTFTSDTTGIHGLSLVVNDGEFDSNVASFEINVIAVNQPPVAIIDGPTTVQLGNSIVLTGDNSYDPEGLSLSYFWGVRVQPNAAETYLTTPYQVTTRLLTDQPGEHVVSLYVNDGELNSAVVTHTITVLPPNQPPVALITGDITKYVGERLVLDGSTSYDPDGDAITYRWTLLNKPSGSTQHLIKKDLVNAEINCDVPGTYFFRLVVNDGSLSSLPAYHTALVGYANRPPVAVIKAPAQMIVNNDIYVRGEDSTDPDGDDLTYAWELVSAPVDSTSALDDSTSMNTLFFADVTGAYTVRLTVNDGEYDSDPTTAVINVVDAMAPGEFDQYSIMQTFTPNSALNLNQASKLFKIYVKPITAPIWNVYGVCNTPLMDFFQTTIDGTNVEFGYGKAVINNVVLELDTPFAVDLTDTTSYISAELVEQDPIKEIIAVDTAWVPNYRAVVYDDEGTYLRTIGTFGTGVGEVFEPYASVVIGDKLHVLERHTNSSSGKCVSVFNVNTGEYITEWGDYGTAPATAVQRTCTHISYDEEEERIYIADNGNHRINVYDTTGGYITTFGGYGTVYNSGVMQNPVSVFPYGDKVYVINGGNRACIKVYNKSNYAFVSYHGIYATDGSTGTFNNPGHLYVYNDEIYVMDMANFRVQVFNLAGEFQRTWGSTGSGDNQWLADTMGITIVNDEVYIADGSGKRILVYTPQGTFIRKWGPFTPSKVYDPGYSSAGTGPDVGQLEKPKGLSYNFIPAPNIPEIVVGNVDLSAYNGQTTYVDIMLFFNPYNAAGLFYQEEAQIVFFHTASNVDREYLLDHYKDYAILLSIAEVRVEEGQIVEILSVGRVDPREEYSYVMRQEVIGHYKDDMKLLDGGWLD